MIEFILGRSGSGKSELIFKAVSELEESSEAILIVPEQSSFYNEKQLSNIYEIMLNKRQIETVFKHKPLADMLCTSECNRIKQNNRLMIRTVGTAQSSLHDLLGSDFDISETPKQIEKFMKYCDESGVCLELRDGRIIRSGSGTQHQGTGILRAARLSGSG